MTPFSEPNEPLDPTAIETWFAGQHRDMGADLTGALDLDTGLHEILLAGQHRDMGTDLASTLDLDAGLAEILPRHQRHQLPPAQFDSFTDLLDWLSAAPTVRLTNRPQLRLLAIHTEILHLTSVHAVERAGALALGIDRTGTLDRPRAHALALARYIDQTIDNAGNYVRSLYHAPDIDQELGLGQAIAIAINIDQTVEHALDLVNARVRNRALARELVHVRICARDVADDVVRALGRVRELLTHILDSALFDAINRVLASARDQAYDLAWRLCGMSVRLEAGDLVQAINGQTTVAASWLNPAIIGRWETDRLNELTADFTGVDLREAKLSGLDLVGVRWSRTTRWPAADVDWIVAASEPVGNGVYVIQGSSASDGAPVVPDPVPV